MNLNNNEIILRRERLHKGIFCLPALAFLLPFVPFCALIFFISIFLHTIGASIQQIQGQPIPIPSILIYLPWLMLTAPCLLICLMTFVPTLLAYLKSEITLTNRRLLFKTGFIMRVSGELPLENIETIFLVEPFLGRIFGFGTILVTSVGGKEFPLRYIGTPKIFHKDLQNAVSTAKMPSPGIKPPAPPADDNSRFMPKG